MRAPKAERSDGPYGLPPPSGCAWVGVWAGWRLHRRMPPLRDLTGRGCLNEAPKARSEFCGPPRTFPDPGRPAATAQGSLPAGRILLPSFLVRARKEGRPPGRVPASQPQSNTTNVKQDASKNIAANAVKSSARSRFHQESKRKHPQSSTQQKPPSPIKTAPATAPTNSPSTHPAPPHRPTATPPQSRPHAACPAPHPIGQSC